MTIKWETIAAFEGVKYSLLAEDEKKSLQEYHNAHLRWESGGRFSPQWSGESWYDVKQRYS